MPLKKEKLSMSVTARFLTARGVLNHLLESSKHGPAILLLGHRVAVSSGSGSLSLSLRDDVGLVDGALYDLLLLSVEVLCEVLVQRRLFLLKLCSLLVLT
jgi:hypothetical protein